MPIVKTKSDYQWEKQQTGMDGGKEDGLKAIVRQLRIFVKNVRDDIFQLNPTIFTTLPTAEKDKRGSFVIKESSSVEDLLNICIRDAAAAFLFKKIALNVNTKGANVDSASSMTLSNDGDYFDIAGTTNITSITIRPSGSQVTLQFNGILTVTDGGNLKLNGDFVTAAESTLTLRSNGTNWFEVSRSPTSDTDNDTITGFNTGTFSRDISTASGNQAVTGVGAIPKAILFFMNGPNANEAYIGGGEAANAGDVLYLNNPAGNSWKVQSSTVIFLFDASGAQYKGVINSFDADGFTIAWTKSGTPTGTININYFAIT